jgi:hypothetical protein
MSVDYTIPNELIETHIVRVQDFEKLLCEVNKSDKILLLLLIEEENKVYNEMCRLIINYNNM